MIIRSISSQLMMYHLTNPALNDHSYESSIHRPGISNAAALQLNSGKPYIIICECSLELQNSLVLSRKSLLRMIRREHLIRLLTKPRFLHIKLSLQRAVTYLLKSGIMCPDGSQDCSANEISCSKHGF